MKLIIKYHKDICPDKMIKKISEYSELEKHDSVKHIIIFKNIINKCKIEQIINLLWIQDASILATSFTGYD